MQQHLQDTHHHFRHAKVASEMHAVLALLHSSIQRHGHDEWIRHGWCGYKDVLRQWSGKLAGSSMRREPENGYSSCSRQRFRVQGHMGEVLRLDPRNVNVPVVGGMQELILPLLSQVTIDGMFIRLSLL